MYDYVYETNRLDEFEARIQEATVNTRKGIELEKKQIKALKQQYQLLINETTEIKSKIFVLDQETRTEYEHSKILQSNYDSLQKSFLLIQEHEIELQNKTERVRKTCLEKKAEKGDIVQTYQEKWDASHRYYEQHPLAVKLNEKKAQQIYLQEMLKGYESQRHQLEGDIFKQKCERSRKNDHDAVLTKITVLIIELARLKLESKVMEKEITVVLNENQTLKVAIKEKKINAEKFTKMTPPLFVSKPSSYMVPTPKMMFRSIKLFVPNLKATSQNPETSCDIPANDIYVQKTGSNVVSAGKIRDFRISEPALGNSETYRSSNSYFQKEGRYFPNAAELPQQENQFLMEQKKQDFHFQHQNKASFNNNQRSSDKDSVMQGLLKTDKAPLLQAPPTSTATMAIGSFQTKTKTEDRNMDYPIAFAEQILPYSPYKITSTSVPAVVKSAEAQSNNFTITEKSEVSKYFSSTVTAGKISTTPENTSLYGNGPEVEIPSPQFTYPKRNMHDFALHPQTKTRLLTPDAASSSPHVPSIAAEQFFGNSMSCSRANSQGNTGSQPKDTFSSQSLSQEDDNRKAQIITAKETKDFEHKMNSQKQEITKNIKPTFKEMPNTDFSFGSTFYGGTQQHNEIFNFGADIFPTSGATNAFKLFESGDPCSSSARMPDTGAGNFFNFTSTSPDATKPHCTAFNFF